MTRPTGLKRQHGATLTISDPKPVVEAPNTGSIDRTQALAALTLTALIWGFTPVAVRVLVRDLPPADLLVLRSAICGVLFAGIVSVYGGWRIAARDLPRFLACALTGVAGYNAFSTFGMQGASASVGSLILGTEPLFIAVFASILLGERLAMATRIGLVSAATGTVLLLYGHAQQSGTAASVAEGVRGPVLMLISAIAWSLYAVIIKPLFPIYGSLRATALTSVFGMLPLLALSSAQTWSTATSMTIWQWTLLVYQSVLSTVIAIFLWNYGNKFVPSASAGSFIYAVPLISVVAGIAFLNEPLTLPLLLAAALIMAGVIIAQTGRR